MSSYWYVNMCRFQGADSLFLKLFLETTNIRVPGTRSKNSSGYLGAKLPEICTPSSESYSCRFNQAWLTNATLY